MDCELCGQTYPPARLVSGHYLCGFCAPEGQDASTVTQSVNHDAILPSDGEERPKPEETPAKPTAISSRNGKARPKPVPVSTPQMRARNRNQLLREAIHPQPGAIPGPQRMRWSAELGRMVIFEPDGSVTDVGFGKASKLS